MSAVVVGAAGACGLGIVRSLSRSDIPVILLDPDRSAPAMYTRFARTFTIAALSGSLLVKDLLALRAQIAGSGVLFLTGDEAARTVSEHRAVLEGSYRFRLPNHDRLMSLMHKSGFQREAETYGFLVPRTMTIGCATDLGDLAQLRFPVIVKPAVKNSEYISRRFQRAYKVATLEEAGSVCRWLLSVVPDLVVQEWIEGPDSNIYFCFQYRAGPGATICSFCGRKLSIWPPDVGVTASCTAAGEAKAELLELTEAFFDRVSFAGMGAIEFKRDSRTGEFFMIEPTLARIDWQEEVATLHGINIPLAAYFYEAGLEVPSMEEVQPPVIWRDSWAHWKSVRNVPGAATVRAKTYDAYWRLNDPVPALARVLRGPRNLLQHISERGRGGLSLSSWNKEPRA